MAAQFVYPVPQHLRGRLLDKPRLYAFPAPPEPPATGSFVFLDSGAFALARRGARIDAPHMRRLAAHYRAHAACDAPPVIAVAPDVYLDPLATLENWEHWQRVYRLRVAPVIQFSGTAEISLRLARMQAHVYAAAAPRVWCVSNPALTGAQARRLGIERVFAALRDEFGAEWIHCLGAGWNTEDVRAWRDCRGLDSFDSIAHYTEPGWSE